MWAILLLLPILAGCASADIRHREATPEALRAMAGYDVSAYTKWSAIDCTIYHQPRDLFRNEECYRLIMEHEERHCEDGAYHPNTPEGSRVLDAQGGVCW